VTNGGFQGRGSANPSAKAGSGNFFTFHTSGGQQHKGAMILTAEGFNSNKIVHGQELNMRPRV
jgi:hypothetical protein